MLLKRGIDIVASIAGLLVLAPLLMLIAACVALDSGFPVFYRQVRIGRGFRSFRILKFRTMRKGEGGPIITIAGDPRITRLGLILRATKLDELPQLWNVLKGEMSIVGPRPEIPQYVQMFEQRYKSILVVRPGLTDLASIAFRSEADILSSAADPSREYLERILPAKLDLAEQYLDDRCFHLDMTILIRTLLLSLRPGEKRG
jgi:lipopolysaccharide/colanic/teichoic acid biosynthesis glycosyltransferase